MMTKTVVSHKSSVVSILFLFLLITYNLQLTTCLAQSISSSELINNAKQYDDQAVVYQGEVIGDIMARGKYAWMNVNDGVNAIGVWVDKSLTRDVVYTGSFKFQGDIVEIEGVFHRACPEHGGDLDIHAASLHKIKEGATTAERINPVKKNLAAVLLGVLCLVLILSRLKRK